jgi:hypothetical protein
MSPYSLLWSTNHNCVRICVNAFCNTGDTDRLSGTISLKDAGCVYIFTYLECIQKTSFHGMHGATTTGLSTSYITVHSSCLYSITVNVVDASAAVYVS